jgi:hypothetical protein
MSTWYALSTSLSVLSLLCEAPLMIPLLCWPPAAAAHHWPPCHLAQQPKNLVEHLLLSHLIPITHTALKYHSHFSLLNPHCSLFGVSSVFGSSCMLCTTIAVGHLQTSWAPGAAQGPLPGPHCAGSLTAVHAAEAASGLSQQPHPSARAPTGQRNIRCRA